MKKEKGRSLIRLRHVARWLEVWQKHVSTREKDPRRILLIIKHFECQHIDQGRRRVISGVISGPEESAAAANDTYVLVSTSLFCTSTK